MNDFLADLVRRHDPDRFLTALFAPPEHRDALLTLYAFNHELARAREVASEPALALIRLQWWREVVDGAPRRHEVASPLSVAIATGQLLPADLMALIDAREREADPAIETLEIWKSWMLAGAGGLAVAAARLLGANEPESFRPAGAAYGSAGVLRGVRVLAAQGRCLLPADLLAAKGLSPEAAIAEPDASAVRDAVGPLVAAGRAWLADARANRLPKAAIAAALPAVLARRDLARWPTVILERGIGDRLAVIAAGMLSRI